jgi:hypothetical protein
VIPRLAILMNCDNQIVILLKETMLWIMQSQQDTLKRCLKFVAYVQIDKNLQIPLQKGYHDM